MFTHSILNLSALMCTDSQTCHGLSVFNILDVEILLIYKLSFKSFLHSHLLFTFYFIFPEEHFCFISGFEIGVSWLTWIRLKRDSQEEPHIFLFLGGIPLPKISASLLRSGLDDLCKWSRKLYILLMISTPSGSLPNSHWAAWFCHCLWTLRIYLSTDRFRFSEYMFSRLACSVPGSMSDGIFKV